MFGLPIVGSIAVRVLIVVGLALACLAAGFSTGVQWQEGKDARAAVRLSEAVKARVITVTKEVVKIQKVYVDREVQREAEHEQVSKRVDDHAALPDPVGCWLDPERVRDINAAFGAVPGAVGANAPGLRTGDPAILGQPSNNGALGGGNGLQIPPVQRPPGGAGGNDPRLPSVRAQ